MEGEGLPGIEALTSQSFAIVLHLRQSLKPLTLMIRTCFFVHCQESNL